MLLWDKLKARLHKIFLSPASFAGEYYFACLYCSVRLTIKSDFDYDFVDPGNNF